MNELEEYFKNNTGRQIHKWHHYFDIYERHFSRFRNKEVVVLEIGVAQGGSLQMWKRYLGDRAQIYGIDTNPQCKMLEEDNVHIIVGSQSDRKFLRQVVQQIPPIDILIDDGGHTMKQQIATFEELFGHIKDDGVYLCEDCHTSYWHEYGGGYKRHGSFIEYTKNWIDYVNAFHSKTPTLKVSEFTLHAQSIHYYDSIVVVEKSVKEKLMTSMTGTPSFERTPFTPNMRQKITNRLRGIVTRSMRYVRGSLFRH